MSSDISTISVLLSGAILVVVAASVWAWRQALERLAAGRPLLKYESRSLPPWGMFDLIVFLFLFVGCQVATGGLLHSQFEIRIDDLDEASLDDRAAVLFASALATLAACLLSLVAVRLRTGACWSELGINLSRFAHDLRLGAVAFVMLAPIVYAIQLVLVNWFESKHPLIELLREQPDPKFFLMSGVAALVVAPLAEEYFFRLLLQGWLQRIASRTSTAMQLLLGGRSPARRESEVSVPLPTAEEPDGSAGEHVSESAPAAQDQPVWPIGVSAFLFAAAHQSHGPDPIPLFFLAVGLGYLYRQTGRLVPCIVVHLMLNGCSLAALCLSVYFGE